MEKKRGNSENVSFMIFCKPHFFFNILLSNLFEIMNEKQILKVKVLFGNCFLAQFLFSIRKKTQKNMYDNKKLFTIFFLTNRK